MLNENEGYAGGKSGFVYRATDGQDWTVQSNPDTQNRTLRGVFFINNGSDFEEWAVGSNGAILHTANGTTCPVEWAGLTSGSLRGIHFTSTINDYVVGNGKTLIKFGEITSVENEGELPTEFLLEKNYPNPFNPSTKIKY